LTSSLNISISDAVGLTHCKCKAVILSSSVLLQSIIDDTIDVVVVDVVADDDDSGLDLIYCDVGITADFM